MSKIKAVLLDFDGVIVDSLPVKGEAFYRLYLSYGKEIAEKVLKYHLANGGVSRFEKFKHFHREFLNKNLDIMEINELSQKFSELVDEALLRCDLAPGFIQYMESYSNEIPHFICSAAPDHELKEVMESHKMAHQFRGIYGSSLVKTEQIEEILKKYKLAPSEVIFIGDAFSDYQVAQNTRVSFIRYGKSDYRLALMDLNSIENFFDLEKFLK